MTLSEELRAMPSSLNDACRKMEIAAIEIDRLQEAKRAALKLADERAKEANELRRDRDKWHRVAMEAGAVTCVDGSHIFPLKQGK